MKKILRVTASAFALGAGLGLVGLGAADVASAHPAPFAPMPDYHWCPGEFFDPAWGPNWDAGRCHDDGFYDGEPRDAGHFHGQGPYGGDPYRRDDPYGPRGDDRFNPYRP